MNRKAQITMFIILGIAIVLLASVLIFLMSSTKDTEISRIDPMPIKVYIDSCVENTAIEGIYEIGARGGYYEIHKNDTEYIEIPYYLYLGESQFPSLETVEKEYSKYVETHLELCINDFKPFRDAGYDFEIKNITAKTTFSGNNINIDIDFPVNIYLNSETAELRKFEKDLKFNFEKKHEIMSRINDGLAENKDMIPIGTLMAEAAENNASYSIIELGDGNVVFALIFNETIMYDEKFMYVFMAKYDWNYLINESRTVDILPINDLYIKENMPFTFKVNATGTNLSFSDYTDLFDIDPSTGTISFTPQKKDRGKHKIIIAASNQKSQDVEIFNIIIEPSEIPLEIEPIPNQEIGVGKTLEYQILISDMYNEKMVYSLAENIQGLELNSETGLLRFTPARKGTYNISVIATDRLTEFAKTSFEVKAE